MEPTLVPDPEQVTVEWLTRVLRHAGDLGPEECVTSFEAEPVGTGQVGRNVRFRLVGTGSGPSSVVAKFPSDDPLSRATGVSQSNYLREVAFYRELRTRVDIRTPRCLFAAFDPERSDFVLVMEDLAPARPGDQIRGCTAPEAALALEELAKLHAPCWADPSLGRIEWLSRTTPESARLLQAFYQAVWPGFLARFGERLSREALTAAERLRETVGAWALSAQGPITVTHGDYRLDNLLFGTREGGPPLAVVDWQTPGEGFALSDAAYFLGAGLPVEERRRHERELLREYHRALRTRGVSGYSWDRCWEDYRRFTWSGVVMAVVASMIVGQSERGDEMFLVMAERHCAHAIDLQAEEFLPARGAR